MRFTLYVRRDEIRWFKSESFGTFKEYKLMIGMEMLRLSRFDSRK
jgi:hypothetical protein